MKLNELKEKCKELGVEPKPTKHRLNPDRYEVSVDDCVKAIQEHVLSLMLNTKGSNYDYQLGFITRNLKSPMLANLISKVDKKTSKDIWDDNNKDWVFEEKVDGLRCFITYNHGFKEYHIYTRALDSDTLLPVDISNRIKLNIPDIPLDFILDTELTFGLYPDMGHAVIEEIISDPYKKIDTYQPRFAVFDIIKLGQYSFLDQKLSFRREEAFKVVLYLAQHGATQLNVINEKPETMTKEEYYNYLVSKGGEGIIAKDLNSTYDKNGSRGNAWIKIKKSRYEGYGNLNDDTYDLFISDATILNNLVNGLVLSSYVVDKYNNYIYDKYGNRQSKEVGILYDLRPELKNMLTSYINNKPVLNDRYLNKVVEVSSSGFNLDTQKLFNLKFICWRIDKTHESCKIKLDEIS